MKYFVIDNFISNELCEKLIFDATKVQNDHIKVLNDRMLLPSTSISFSNLKKNSLNWKKLDDHLSSQKFLQELCKKLNINDENYIVTNFFQKSTYSKLHNIYKHMNNNKVVNVSTFGLIFYFFFRLFRNLTRIFKYKFSYQNYVELLYDYSKSPNGYFREIHRDSDSRTVVFLLYLNELDKGATGGELNFYEFKDKNIKIPSQPSYEECNLIKSIPPKAGRLVAFLNSHDSLHSVSLLKNHEGYRHFLYGSFTLLGKKNPLIKNNTNSLKTNFNIFD